MARSKLSTTTVAQLEDTITVEQFSQLVKMFQERGERRRSAGTTQLTTADFRQVLAQLLGYSEDDDKIIMLCNKVCKECYMVCKVCMELITLASLEPQVEKINMNLLITSSLLTTSSSAD